MLATIYTKNINQVFAICSAFTGLEECEPAISSTSLVIRYSAPSQKEVEHRLQKLVKGGVLRELDKHNKAYLLKPNKKCDNVDNDELYDDLANFLERPFIDIEDFYKKLYKYAFRLEKKHRLNLGPNEYIFLMRHIPELKFGQP